MPITSDINPIDLLDPKPSERTSGLEWVGMKVELLKKSDRLVLATVSGSDTQHERGIVQSVPLAALVEPHAKIQKVNIKKRFRCMPTMNIRIIVGG